MESPAPTIFDHGILQSLPWTEPMEMARRVNQPWWVLLYSSAQASYSGRYSYLGCDIAQRLVSNDFDALEKRLGKNGHPLAGAWFGTLGYGLKDCLETLPADAPGRFILPAMTMLRFKQVFRFDHETKTVERWTESGDLPLPSSPRGATYPPRVSNLSSNMSREEYLDKAARVIARIRAGDLYQANLTRKFLGTFESRADGFGIFERLCEVSPAPYSAFLRLGDVCVASSSPELFLRITPDGRIVTRPIKGTAPRHADPAQDAASRAALAASEKDRAENLMIADLMRNDLSRACVPGSVVTDSLFDVTTHATIHHMSSTVSGLRREDCSVLGAVKHCFPPGSMTGAPKVAAMKLCTEMERQARGIYSGAIGRFGGDGSAELSVAIRTLVIRGEEFEFQVGGGIIADSTPEGELEELIDKSTGIMMCLGLNKQRLRDL